VGGSVAPLPAARYCPQPQVARGRRRGQRPDVGPVAEGRGGQYPVDVPGSQRGVTWSVTWGVT